MLLAGAMMFALANSSFGQAIVGVNLTNTITASIDGGTSKSGDTWYELGVNGLQPTTGIQLGLVTAAYDPFSTYLFRPGDGLNVLMLDSANPTGTLTFTRPISVVGLSLAGSSGHGSGTTAMTLRFSDGTSSSLSAVVGDWFNNSPRIQTSNGRINIFNNAFNNVNSDNPRILAINTGLATADQSKFLSSIDFSWTGSAADTVTAIFGVSGDVTGIGHFTAIPLEASSFNHDVIVGMAEVPEPGTLALVGLGVAGLLIRARRNRGK
jgi:hypothetical protein